MPIDPLTPSSAIALLGRPPQLAADDAALRARQVIKANLFPERTAFAPQIGRFIVLRELGRGGMGVVYVAYDETLDRRVALKLLYEMPGDDTDGQARLLREAQSMARLNHPNIAAVYEAGTHEGRVYVAMEFIQGRPLDIWLRDRSRPWREVVDVFIQAGRGLLAAHCAGLVHRDFKPANVMLGGDGRVRVLDFGLARGIRVLASDATLGPLATMSVTLPVMPPGGPLTREGLIVGTPAYMPPEQFRGQPVDARVDQYALCVSLYEGLYGRLPFHGETLPDLWAAVLDGPPRTQPRGSRVPGWLHRVLLRGLDPEPGRRFSTMAALLAALEQRPRKHLHAWLRATLAAGAFAGSLYGVENYRNAACTFGTQELAGLWDADRKAGLRSVINDDAIWSSMEQKFDASTQRWLDAQGEVCRAQQSGKEPIAIYERRQHCLFKYKLALSATIDVLTAQAPMSPASIEQVVEAFERNEPRCTTDLSEDGSEPPPEHLVEATTKLWGDFYSLRVKMYDAFEPARLEDARNLTVAAKKLGYLPVTVYALWLRSELESQGGLKHEACESLQEGYHLADAARMDLQAATNAANIVDVCSDTWNPEMLDVWARLALAKIERIEKTGHEAHLKILMQLASSMLNLGRLNETGQYILAGTKIVISTPARFAEDTSGTEHTSLLLFVAQRFLSRSSDEEQKNAVRKAMLEVVRKTTKDSGVARVQALMSEANSHTMRGEWKEAEESAARVILVLSAVAPTDHSAMATAMLTLASAKIGSEKCAEPLNEVDSVFRFPNSWQKDDSTKIIALAMATALHASCGDLGRSRSALSELRTFPKHKTFFFADMSEAFYETEAYGDVRGVSLSEHTLAQSRKLGVFLGQTTVLSAAALHAEASVRAGKFEKARRAAEEALSLGELEWGATNIALAGPLTVLGKVELEAGNIDMAIAHLERALALRDESDPQYRADTLFALARALAKKPGVRKRARAVGEQALAQYAAAGPRRGKEHEEVRAWLAGL